jgi:hypothetical protein
MNQATNQKEQSFEIKKLKNFDKENFDYPQILPGQK